MPITLTGDTGVVTPGLTSTNMPTSGGDPIVQSGSNADGAWTRWADGTATAHVHVPGTTSLIKPDTAEGSIYKSNEYLWTFPNSFIEAPGVSGSPRVSTSIWVKGRPTSTTQGALQLFSSISVVSAPSIDIFAIGRWK